MNKINNNYLNKNIKERNAKTKCKKGVIYKIEIYNNRIPNCHTLKSNYLIVIIFLFFQKLLKEFSKEEVNAHSSIITIKIKQSGLQNIFNDGNSCYRNKMFALPDEVIINNVKQNNISAKYDFKGTDNTIQLKWNEDSDNWGCLFKNCININEIDFSQFNFSQDIQGNYMFCNCRSLTSININDFGKVKLKDAGSFFRNMASITSLNLSNFDMSEVTDIGWMFAGCTSLTSLDLSNLHINSINIPVTHTFWECSNLEYINLNNTHFNLANEELISAKKNLVFCNQDTEIIKKINEYGCPINDCSEN